jgi:hypothetical protein
VAAEKFIANAPVPSSKRRRSGFAGLLALPP